MLNTEPIGRFPPMAPAVFDGLSHPRRLKIAEALAEVRSARFGELRKLTNLASGSLGDHLNSLIAAGIVQKIAYPKESGVEVYTLTDLGKQLLDSTFTVFRPVETSFGSSEPNASSAKGSDYHIDEGQRRTEEKLVLWPGGEQSGDLSN